MELLDSLRHHTRDVHKQAGGERSAQTPNRDTARSSQGVQEVTGRATARPSDASPSRSQKRRRANTDNQATASAVAVPNSPLVAHLAGPSHSGTIQPQSSAVDQASSNTLTQIVPLRHSEALEHQLGSFMWESLLSRQKDMIAPITSIPAFLHIPTDRNLDFMLELPVTANAGNRVARALQRSFETLADILGPTVFEGVRQSNSYTTEIVARSDGKISAVQVLHGEHGICTITCFLDFRTGRTILLRCGF